MTVDRRSSTRCDRSSHQAKPKLPQWRLDQIISRSVPNLFGDEVALPEWLDFKIEPAPHVVGRLEPWCRDPTDCDHRDGDRSTWDRTSFGEALTERWRDELDCRNPVAVWCVRCGEQRWKRCGSGSVRDCRSCAHRKLQERRHQISDAVTMWLQLGVCVYWITLSFPGFGGCDPRMCDCNDIVAAFFAEHPKASRRDWVMFFNGRASLCFRDWKQGFEREFGVRFEHVRLMEVQDGKRKTGGGDATMAYHFHALIVTNAPVSGSKRQFTALANHHGFGHSFDFQLVDGDPIEILRRVGYITSYAKHSVDGIRDAPYLHPSRTFDEWSSIAPAHRRSRCRAITMSRGFSESLQERRRRYRQQMVRRAAIEVLRAQQEDSGCVVGAPGAAGAGGAGGALESLVAELHKWSEPIMPANRLVTAM